MVISRSNFDAKIYLEVYANCFTNRSCRLYTHKGSFNPITYSILRFRQLRGGAFWLRPRRQGYGYRIDLKFATNNGTDDTSKRAKFNVIGCSTFRDMRSEKFPFQKGTSHRDSIFTSWNRAKLEKQSLFIPENIFSGTKSYPLCISMVFKQNKKIIIC